MEQTDTIAILSRINRCLSIGGQDDIGDPVGEGGSEEEAEEKGENGRFHDQKIYFTVAPVDSMVTVPPRGHGNRGDAPNRARLVYWLSAHRECNCARQTYRCHYGNHRGHCIADRWTHQCRASRIESEITVGKIGEC